MARRFDFERLEVYAVALEVVDRVDRLADELPADRSDLRDAVRRAATAIPVAIARASGDLPLRTKARGYFAAGRTATALASRLLVCRRLGLGEPEALEEALDLLQRVAAMLSVLTRRCAERDAA